MPESADPHGQELLRALGERRRTGSRPGRRTDGLRIALAIEGGAMRGTVSAGMALALHELGLTSAFDAVYGASAGAITGAWLLSSRPEGLRGWTEPSYASTLIRWSALLRGRPVVDVRTLIEVVYQTEFPMDFGSVLASEVEYHPLATDAITGESIDLRPLITDPAELRLALRASASLPFLAGPPVRLRGRRFYDAGIAESVPFRTPLAQGATHILVLRSRGLPPPAPNPARPSPAEPSSARPSPAEPSPAEPSSARPSPAEPSPARPHSPAAAFAAADGGPTGAGLDTASPDNAPDREYAPGQPANGIPVPRPPRSVRLLARTTLRNESSELRAALFSRGARTAVDVAHIAELEAVGRALSVRPPVDAPPVTRLTTDGALLAAAFEAGRAAAHELLA
jgi:predicted acylesterase/phospholipase RssA